MIGIKAEAEIVAAVMPSPGMVPKCDLCQKDLQYFYAKTPTGCPPSAEQCRKCSSVKGAVCSKLYTSITPAFYCGKCQTSLCYPCGVTSIPITVEWWSEDPHSKAWVQYAAADALRLEAGFQQKQTVTLTLLGNNFTVDTTKASLQQCNASGGSRRVERRVKGGTKTITPKTAVRTPAALPDAPPVCGKCFQPMSLTSSPPIGYNTYGDYHCDDCNQSKQFASSTLPAYHCEQCRYDLCKQCAPKHVKAPKCHQCAHELNWTASSPGAALGYTSYGDYQCIHCQMMSNFTFCAGYHCAHCGISNRPKYDLCGKCGVQQICSDAIRGLLSSGLADLFLRYVPSLSNRVIRESQEGEEQEQGKLTLFLKDLNVHRSSGGNPQNGDEKGGVGDDDATIFLFICNAKGWRSLSFNEFESACTVHQWEKKEASTRPSSASSSTTKSSAKEGHKSPGGLPHDFLKTEKLLHMNRVKKNIAQTIEKYKTDFSKGGEYFESYYAWCFGKQIREAPTKLLVSTPIALKAMQGILLLSNEKERKKFASQQEALFKFLSQNVKGVSQKLWDDILVFLKTSPDAKVDPFRSVAIDEFVTGHTVEL